jgi:hypothetical protein
MRLLDRLARLLLPAPADLVDYPFVASDVALYQRTVHGHDDNDGAVDPQTWTDLLLAQYSARLAPGTSIFGQQELHRRLLAPDGSTVPASAAQVRALVAEPDRRQRLQTACEGLRRADREVSETLFGATLAPTPRWVRLLGWLPPVFLASIVLALVLGWLPLWGAAIVLWLALMAIQVQFHDAAAQWQRVLDTIAQLLRAHVLLAGLDDPASAALRPDAGAAGKLNRRLARSPLANMTGMREYSEWIWLSNIRHYFASRAVVAAHLPLLRASFARVAAVEADVALARHLAHTPLYCWAETGPDAESRFAFEQAVHPLLAAPAPLSLRVGDDGRGAFISGQNGIGKSTLLRTVGLNLITARAFGFCYAQAAVTPGLPVYASMQNEDALDSGESLYVAEVRRAGELLALSRRGPAIFLIDEIFRGTNHLESVSAAAAVLDTLAASGRVLVSSHNVILARLLARRLAPLCVERLNGRLLVSTAILKETNGMALLATIDRDGVLAAKSARVYDRLGDYYLAYPDGCDSVLD